MENNQTDVDEKRLRDVLAWQEAGIRKALEAADRGEFAPDEEMKAIFARFITG